MLHLVPRACFGSEAGCCRFAQAPGPENVLGRVEVHGHHLSGARVLGAGPLVVGSASYLGGRCDPGTTGLRGILANLQSSYGLHWSAMKALYSSSQSLVGLLGEGLRARAGGHLI